MHRTESGLQTVGGGGGGVFSSRSKRSAFYMGLKSKVRLVAAKSSVLRINLNIQGCSVVAPSLHALSRSPSPPPSFTQYPSFPRSLVRDGQTSPHRPQLVVSRSTCPPLFIPPTREQLCNRYCSNKHTARTNKRHHHLSCIYSKVVKAAFSYLE